MAPSTFPFTCPHCGHSTQVPLDYADQEGPCVVCNKPVVLPNEEAARQRIADAAKQPRQDYTSPLIAGVALTIAAGLIVGVMMATGGFRWFSDWNQKRVLQDSCQSNLQLISVALHSYHRRYQSFPPAYLADETGKPMHSWRVLILPDLGYPELYDQYDLSKPWNDPQNLRLDSQMPPEYACPADPHAGLRGETNYFALTGSQTAFPRGESTQMSELATKKGLSETALLVEAPSRGFSWLNPLDLDVARMLMRVNGSPLDAGSRHAEAHVLMADGSIRKLAPDMRPDVLRSTFTAE